MFEVPFLGRRHSCAIVDLYKPRKCTSEWRFLEYFECRSVCSVCAICFESSCLTRSLLFLLSDFRILQDRSDSSTCKRWKKSFSHFLSSLLPSDLHYFPCIPPFLVYIALH